MIRQLFSHAGYLSLVITIDNRHHSDDLKRGSVTGDGEGCLSYLGWVLRSISPLGSCLFQFRTGLNLYLRPSKKQYDLLVLLFKNFMV